MNTQSIMMASRATHVRELKAEIAKLKAENAALRGENEELHGHLDLALLAAADLADLGESGSLVIVDGWNLILGAGRAAADRGRLRSLAEAYLADHPSDRVWIVLDGPRAASETYPPGGRLRISYTGGTGAHRADRLVCDYLRMARFRGDANRARVVTRDRDFARDVMRLTGRAASTSL